VWRRERGQTLPSRCEKPWNLEIRNLWVGGHGTYHQALSGGVHMARSLQNRPPWSVVWFLGCSRVRVPWPVAPEGSPSDSRTLPPVGEWCGRPWHWTPCFSHLVASESDVSSLLGRNWWPTVPEIQEPDSSPRASIKRVAGADHLANGRIGTHMVLWGWS
jgi:hypothetical protein